MGVGYYECNYASIGRQAPRQTIRWLDKHGVPYRDLCFMGQKDQVGADAYIDDSPDNIAGLRAAGHYAICFANSANKEIEAPRAGRTRLGGQNALSAFCALLDGFQQLRVQIGNLRQALRIRDQRLELLTQLQ